MCPTLTHLWHVASLKEESLGSCLPRRQRKQSFPEDLAESWECLSTFTAAGKDTGADLEMSLACEAADSMHNTITKAPSKVSLSSASNRRWMTSLLIPQTRPLDCASVLFEHPQLIAWQLRQMSCRCQLEETNWHYSIYLKLLRAQRAQCMI